MALGILATHCTSPRDQEQDSSVSFYLCSGFDHVQISARS